MNGLSYADVEAELQRWLDRLYGADAEAIAAAQDRLRALAEQIEDETERQRAHRRIEALPKLLAGPRALASPEFVAAHRLFAAAIQLEGPVQARIVEVEQAVRAIGELAGQVQGSESMAILALNSPLARLLEQLRQAVR